MNRRLAGAAVILGAVFSVLMPASTALAHAELQSSSPSAGSVLDSSPSQIVLTFSENVDTVDDSIRLVTGDGTDIPLDGAGHSLGSDTLTVSVPTLADGTYVVAWKAISSDSHPVSGAFSFSVGTQTSTQPGLIDRLVEQESTSRRTQVWLGIGRWASFGGIAVLVGALLTVVRCVPTALRRRRTTITLVVAAALAIAGTALMIVAQASIVSGDAFDPSAWRAVAETASGTWWVVRLVLVAIGLVGILALRPHRPDREQLGTVGLGVLGLGATGLLAVVAAGGHGVTGRVAAVGFLATWVHLAAMCTWVGGLVTLAVLAGRDQVREAAARFSPIALGSVAALVITGTVNAWRQSDSWSALRDSSYGRWLLAKLVVVVGVVAVAGVSRWLVTSANTSEETDRAVHRAVRLEMLGVAVVLAMTAGLVSSPPPRHDDVAPVTVSDVEGDRIAQIVIDPPVTGGTTMHVYVTSTAGTLVQPISTTVTASLADRGIDHLDLNFEQAGPGHLTSDAIDLPIAGTWTFTVDVRYSEFDSVQFVLEADIH